MLDTEAQIWIKLPHPAGAYGPVVNQHQETESSVLSATVESIIGTQRVTTYKNWRKSNCNIN